MADFDATEVTECIVDRKKGMRTRDTAGAEIARLTGLDLDVAKALTDGWSGKTSHKSEAGHTKTKAVVKIVRPDLARFLYSI